ncbi:MAG: hypothetical protein JNJ48_08160 [Phycisphaerae bacterium]|nr:hypothetical protein [Phycisphaerae bacterium]
MNTHRPDDWLDLNLEAFLDGLLPPDQHAEFLRLAERRPDILQHIADQRQLADSLRAVYRQPAIAPGPQPLPAPPQARSSILRRLLPLAAAAAVALVAILSLRPGAPAANQPLYAEYQRQADRGFIPDEVCTSDEAFADWTRQAFGHALVPQNSAGQPAVQIVGWCNRPIFSVYTGVLLARSDGRGIVVLIDKAAAPHQPPHDSARGPQHVFTRTVGGLHLYEVSPFPEARVIGRIVSAQ